MRGIMDATSKAQKLKSLDRALRLLDILSKTRDPLSAAQISKTLGVKRTASYAMLNTLVEHAYLEKDPVTDNYRIGSRLFELGQRYRYRFPFCLLYTSSSCCNLAGSVLEMCSTTSLAFSIVPALILPINASGTTSS